MVAGVARGQPLFSVLLGTELPLVLGLLCVGRGGGAVVLVALLAATSLAKRYLMELVVVSLA